MKFIRNVISLEGLLERWGCPEKYLVGLYANHLKIYIQNDSKYQNFLTEAWYDCIDESYHYYDEYAECNDWAPDMFVRFDMDEVERYELYHPGLNKNEGRGDINSTTKLVARIAELEAQLEEANRRANEAEGRTDYVQQEIVTVDAALWETSCRAACSVLVEIVGSGEMGITNAVFLERMKALAPGKRTHTKADKIAWKALPDRHKNGPGCPKK